MSNAPQLDQDQWLELYERLVYHAHCKMARLSWRGVRASRGGKPPGGLEATDLAATAIEQVLAGDRVWNPDTHPDFLAFLKSVVDSHVNHLAECADNAKTRRMEAGDSHKSPGKVLQLESREPDPAIHCADLEAADRFRAAVRKELQSDELAGRILECIEAGITKPQEIAEVLGQSVADINNAQKRLRRKVESVMSRMAAGGKR